MQKQGLPRSCGRLPCSFPGLLTSRRKLWNHLKSSNDFSPLVNSFQPPSFLCTSPWFSSTLFSSLSSPLNSFQLVLAHLTSVPLPMLVRCPCCPLSGLIVCLCCHVNAQPLPAVHGGALQQTNWRLPVQETVAHLLVLKTCYSRRLNQASFI